MSLLEDRLDIIETCTRMGWHADRREWERLVEVFAEQVALDYISLNGGEPVALSPAQIVEAWTGVLGSFLVAGTARNINGADYVIGGGQSKTT
ncbi:nuclear transport factor 2 family protein [Nonomuraea sp. H19]|uniref:nuclear transport factor 2 family protein n=1 Tax=Nonomuraea sp. H19 TaxID=3452206 RepID=UPI003F8B243F